MDKRTMIPIAEVKDMLYMQGEYLASADPREILEEFDGDLTVITKAMLFQVMQYEEGKPWDVFNERGKSNDKEH